MATTDTTKEVAAADPPTETVPLTEPGLPRVHQAEVAPPKVHQAEIQAPQAEAPKARPAEAVLHPIPAQAAAVTAPPPGVAIPLSNATRTASSPAAAGDPVMAAIQAAADREAIPAQAAAAAAANTHNEAFHYSKQIELATALFVCSKSFE